MSQSVQPPRSAAETVTVPSQGRIPPDDAAPARVMAHSEAASGPSTVAAAGAAAPAASFPLRGQTDHFLVYFDDSLGGNGAALADALLATCEADYGWMQNWFGVHTTGQEFHVYVQPGTNGARHATCASTTIFVDAFAGTDGDLARYLLVSEVSEVFMAVQGAGWNCGYSNGEALSRVLAEELYPGKADQSAAGFGTFYSAWKWMDNGRPNWIDTTEQVDTDFVSIGCGTLFLNWLQYQLGYTLTSIVAAGGPNLASTYQQLTGLSDGFTRFSALLQRYFPAGTPSGLGNDNPFPLTDPTPPLPSRTLTSAGVLYQVHSDGALNWNRYNRWSNGESDWTGPTTVGRNWLGFPRVFGGGGFVIYAIDGAGMLRWYRHDGANSGTGLETPGAWAPGSGTTVAHGWQGFSPVFSPGGGVLYGIDAQGQLVWYRHLAFETGAPLETPGSWANGGMGRVVGQGWNEFVATFAFLAPSVRGAAGFPAAVIYGVLPDGTLRWYRHDAAGTGQGLETAGAWAAASGTAVGRGWNGFVALIAPGEGAIFAVSSSGTVRRYVHTGFATGQTLEQGGWETPSDVRYGWTDLSLAFSLAPGLPAPGPN